MAMQINELSALLKQGGVVGAGGAGFPSYAKLNEKADTIILNCAECEPLLKLHRQVLEKYADDIVFALDAVAKAVGADNIIIAIKPHYKEAVAAAQKAISAYSNMKIGFLPEIYPAGDEVVTIYETTGRVVKPGNIPITVGVIVFNVETMLNAAKMIKENKGVTYKYVTVAGEVKKPCTLKAPLGITYKELIEKAGGATINDYVIVAGGPMTGMIGYDSDVVTKTSNAILVMPKNAYIVLKRQSNVNIDIKRAMSVCCQCQMCTDLCSRNLLGHPIEPHSVMRAVAGNETENTKVFLNTFFCSACGLCELYSCPQDLNPRTIIAKSKSLLKKGGIAIPKDVDFDDVNKARPYRTVPMGRLIARLGLRKYDVASPMEDTLVDTKSVKIMLSQNIGAPSVPCVKVGDSVKAGDVIANAPDGLGVVLHCSLDGKVVEVTDRFIVINK